MATHGRKRYFHIDENASSEQIYALLDVVGSADKDDIDKLMNDSDTEFIAEEEITQAASTQDTSLTTPEANLHVVPSDNQSKRKEKSKNKELWKQTKVEQSNLYAHQNGRNFTVTKEELKAFLGINFVMAINKLPTIAEYWRVDNLIGNDGIQNTMIRMFL